jgi:serine/threonine-protein kinase ULK4
MNNYHICEIGRSKNSVVYKGRLKKTIEYLAIKSSEKIHKAKVMNEVRILENTSHENIVEFYGFHKTRNHLWVVLEYCPGGDILTLIDQDKHLPESVIKDFGLNIMDGLFYLHSKQIIYADLKPSNILFNEYGVLKLCDFGLARLISDAQTEDSKKGTPYYMAPELFEEGGVYSYYSDLWSLGCVLYELAVGTPPFVSNTFKDLKDQILNAETPYILGASDAFNDLISGLLQKDPSKRMGWEEILWHEFWDGKRLIQVNLPSHPSYEQYLKSKGLVQRTNGYKNFLYSYDNKKFEARESIRTSFNGKEDFVIKNRDQVFNFGENWDFEEKSEEAKVVHQRSNSAALQTPAAKNNFKPQPVDQLLLHNTDTIVKPIINSYESLLNTIEINLTRWYPEDITDQVNSPELESHLSEVYTILNSSSPVGTKISYLLYLESLIIDFPIANKLINSGFVELFLKISKSSELKSRICSLFGQMLRHATIIDSDLPRSSISDYFIKIINEDAKTQTEILIKRKALAALGEYLFFAATQMDEEEYDVAWEIDKKIVNILTHEASLNQDEVCRLYAVRTIENITAQSKNGGVIFALAVIFI